MRGDVAGSAQWEGGRAAAVVWPAGTNTAKVFASQGPLIGADAIGDDGTVYGVLNDFTAFAWHPDGTGEALPGTGNDHVLWIRAVAGQWVVGHRSYGAVVWNLAARTVTEPASSVVKNVQSANAQGWLAGATRSYRGEPVIQRHTTQRLPSLRPDEGYGTAEDLSDDGKTVTGIVYGGDSRAAVVWHC